ncbi:MAG: DUF1080 domain-containing protein [Planctomycetota bacterium]|nr:DUF1080 domain-containing protein [Planctomycetota bacterium]
MKLTHTLMLLLSASCASTAPQDPIHNVLSAEQVENGWQLLFDGSSTDSWRNFRGSAEVRGWEARAGNLVCTGGGGDLITKETYGSFILDLEWRIGPGGNSGIFFHVTEDHNAVWETGPEVQILDNEAHGLDPRALTAAGANYALHAPQADVVAPVGQFNRVRLIVIDDRVVHYLNGTRIVAYTLGSEDWRALVQASKFGAMPGYGVASEGHIALQDHGDEVRYRNIRILRL